MERDFTGIKSKTYHLYAAFRKSEPDKLSLHKFRCCNKTGSGTGHFTVPFFPACFTGKTRDVRTVKADQQRNRSEEHTSELQSRGQLVCRLLLEKKKKSNNA